MCLLMPFSGQVLPSQNVPILPCDQLPLSYCTLIRPRAALHVHRLYLYQSSFDKITVYGIVYSRDANKDLTPKHQDKNKDLTLKDQDKDKYLTPKDQD